MSVHYNTKYATCILYVTMYLSFLTNKHCYCATFSIFCLWIILIASKWTFYRGLSVVNSGIPVRHNH